MARRGNRPHSFPHTRESEEGEDEREKALEEARYQQGEAALRNMLKEAMVVKAKTECQCASVLDCKPCVYGAQGRPLDS